MPRRFAHDGEHLLDEHGGKLRVEEIRHAVDEDPLRRPPAQRQIDAIVPEPWRKWICSICRCVAEGCAAEIHRPSFRGGHDGRIAMIATFRDLRATRHWVPGRIRPFYPCADRHVLPCPRELTRNLCGMHQR